MPSPKPIERTWLWIEFISCRGIVRQRRKSRNSVGKEPVAPHLFYTQFLDDAVPDEREAGLGYGLFDLRASQEFLLVVIDGIISEGIKAEIAEASRLGIHGRIVAMGIRQIKEAMKVVV